MTDAPSRALAASDVTFRPMHWTDVPNVSSLEAVLFPDDAWSVETFWSELAGVPASRWYTVAEISEFGIAGYAGLRVVDTDADVQTIAVAPQAQGVGVGRALLRKMLAEARRRGATHAFLDVRADNAAALALYESAGFVELGRRAGYYSGRVDAVVMRMALVPEGGDGDE